VPRPEGAVLVRYAVAVACVVLILVLVLASGFDPLLVPAVIGGLLLGLLVRTLWSNRSRLPRSIRHRAILVALLAAALVAAFITSNIANLQRSAPTIRVPQILDWRQVATDRQNHPITKAIRTDRKGEVRGIRS
jgi:ABC-type Fe3+-siderophore transport system permease subunit